MRPLPTITKQYTMRKIILIFSLILYTSTIYGQYSKSSEALTAEFFAMYKRDTNAAFDFIFETNEWLANDKEEIGKIKAEVLEYKTTLGDYMGFEKLINKHIGGNLNVFVYLVKYERRPLKFIFKYYKSKNKWMLYKFKIEENIDRDIDKIIEHELLNKF